MKAFLWVIGCSITWLACGPGQKNTTKPPVKDTTTVTAEDKSYLKKRPEEFPEFFRLSSVQPFSGRVATKADLDSGKAVFVLNAQDPSHTVCAIRLPFFAFHKVKGGDPVFVAVMQAEVLKGDTLLGYREASGLFGMCRPNELEYFENEKAVIFTPVSPGAQ